MNHYDSIKIINYLKYYGNYKILESFDYADIIILNTCSIREKSENKFFNFLNKFNKIKKNNSNLIICLCGCLSTQLKKKVFNKSNLIDIVCGPQSIHKLHYLIEKFIKNNKKLIDIKSFNINKNINNFNYKYNFLKNIKIYSYVSIIEGCNNYCSYCIVPFTRGKQVSRYPEDIFKEICNLSINNIKEINLLGQNVNSYLSKFSNGNKCDFSDLLYLISDIKKIKRIRFTTSHPFYFNDKIINCYKNIDKIVNFLHLPVQSGSNKILKLMKRKYSIEFYKDLINKILFFRPNLTFSTDFIVGYPNESEKDFLLTLDLIKEIKFDHSYIFMYSPRPGTLSYNFDDNIDINEKKRRFFEIKKLIDSNVNYYNNNMLNNIYKILVEGISKKNKKYLFGRTENNRKVFFKSKNCLIGNIVNVKIKKIYNNYLYGNLLTT